MNVRMPRYLFLTVLACAALLSASPAFAQFSQQAKLVATGGVGNPLQGTSVAVSADGTTAIVGAPADNGNAGAAWVYTRNGSGIWTQEGDKLFGTSSLGNAQQGKSVA